MRGIMVYTFFIVVFLLSVFSQTLHFEENFDYDLGKLPEVSTDWIYSPDGSFDIEVIDGNLSYSGYAASNTGRKINLDGGASGRTAIQRSFPIISANGSSIYVSFLLNVTSTSDMDLNTSTGDYFAHFAPSSGTAYRTRVHVRQGSEASKFSIGLGKSSTTGMEWFSTELDVGATYLIVMSYHFQSGDDETKLWINPSLSGSEPLPDISLTSGADASDLEHFKLRQGSDSGDMDIDGIRVSDSWDQAPLPVELTSFTADFNESSQAVELSWETATETNNAGFEVHRSLLNDQFNEDEFEVLGFVAGNGTVNSPRYYEYNDTTLPDAENLWYRLKQIDNDGEYAYSKVRSVSLSNVTGIEDEDLTYEFSLAQNYPNPFNPTTRIKFSLPEGNGAQIVSLKVYNLLAQEVATLVNETKPSGVYEVEFDASQLQSGVYFYSLNYGEFKRTKKLLLIK